MANFLRDLRQPLLATLLAIGLSNGVAAMPVEAGVEARIDLSDQQMQVYVNGFYYASWKVSTARRGYRTPTGTYKPKWLARMHYSKKYDNSPMPHSIFFYGGYAIHGTNYIKRLGTPASHGCVRLHPSNAAKLFALVREYGMKHTTITITQ
jgi:lipoprotein-anchoring transpeptidase ErfK/SrfK